VFGYRKDKTVMKARTLIQTLCMALIASCACLAQDVRYNFDKDTDFMKFRTYRWVTVGGAGQVNEMVEKQIQATIDTELAKKGLERVEGAQPADLFIGYQAAVSKEKEFSSYSTDWGYGGGWNRGGWYGSPGGGMTTGQTSTIYVGELALDMYSSANQTLVWRGTATKTLDPKAKPEKQQKNLSKAVAKMLKNYPPKKKS
jgi:hypothetical protein